jgi:hypothetical protein
MNLVFSIYKLFQIYNRIIILKYPFFQQVFLITFLSLYLQIFFIQVSFIPAFFIQLLEEVELVYPLFSLFSKINFKYTSFN